MVSKLMVELYLGSKQPDSHACKKPRWKVPRSPRAGSGGQGLGAERSLESRLHLRLEARSLALCAAVIDLHARGAVGWAFAPKPVANVTTKVDGREVKRLIISKEMQLYFARLNGKEKSREWFAVVSLFGKKALLVRAVETQAGKSMSRRTRLDTFFTMSSSGLLPVELWLGLRLGFSELFHWPFSVEMPPLRHSICRPFGSVCWRGFK